MSREAVAAALAARSTPFDVVVIGGGANGAGIAFDCASRGYTVALVERAEFASGTSSRSSKLVHGGLRYLALGQWGLVREALAERARLLANAPAIVSPLGFLVPLYGRFDALRFPLGLWLYDRLAGNTRLARSRRLDRGAALARAPTLARAGLRGAASYMDAGFDDARLVQALLARARALGALTLNHAEAVGFTRTAGGRIDGVAVGDRESGTELTLPARAVINAAGPWGDRVRTLDGQSDAAGLTPSQGTHVVVPAHFLGGDDALVFPHTPDGRIMFAIPWQGQALLGTTDVPAVVGADNPLPQDTEIDDILAVAATYLETAPTRADVLSTFAGLRPLAGAPDGAATARRSREHRLDVAHDGLVSVSGGKWTTYRLIAEQAVDLAAEVAGLPRRAARTATLPIAPQRDDTPVAFRAYGDDAGAVAAIAAADPALAAPLDARVPGCGADYVWAARAALAVHVDDALAWHTRALFVDAAAAHAIAPRVAALMAAELGRDAAWVDAETARARACAERFALTPIRARETPG
ncbi:MAG: glycerol-3-phosphate dehydrogenase/oxidase [Gammaproteobacteria bacterium]